MQTIGLCKESPRSEENNIQRTRKGQAVESKKERTVVFHYLHNISYRLKNVALRYRVGVVFSAKNKLSKISPAIES